MFTELMQNHGYSFDTKMKEKRENVIMNSL